MLSKRRVRFSIGAMLVVMTIVAVLLNHEVQRAKAIETTEKKIKEWQGQVFFRPRANTSSFLANVLPQYWTAEIVGIDIASYRYGRLVIDNQVKDTFIDRLDFERVVELGALDNLQFADFSGPAIRYAHITSVCEAASMRQCNLFDASITADEFENLKQAYPSINIPNALKIPRMIVQRRMRFSIGAMLVVMAAVAVLLSREVQRAALWRFLRLPSLPGLEGILVVDVTGDFITGSSSVAPFGA